MSRPSTPAVHSFSTVLLAGAAALALTTLLLLIPWSAIGNIRNDTASITDWVSFGVFVGSPVWIGMFFYLTHIVQQYRQRHALNGTQHIPWTGNLDAALASNLRQHFPILDTVQIYVRGQTNTVKDSGAKIAISPRSYHIKSQRVLVFSALAWQRLQQNTGALGAILAHELAHFQHRDMEWLQLARRLLLAVSIVFCIYYLISSYASIQQDLAKAEQGFDWVIVQATLAGKSFAISGLITLMLLALYVKTLGHWREALADFAAVSSQGETALAQAEHLMYGNTGAVPTAPHVRPTTEERRTAVILMPYHWLLLGSVIAITTNNTMGQLAYLITFSSQGSVWIDVYTWLRQIIDDLLPFLGYLLLFAIFAKHNKALQPTKKAKHSLALPGFLLIVGASLGYLLTQTLPLIITSIGMPDGYDYVHMHAPIPLLAHSLVSQLSLNAWLVILALLGATGLLITGNKLIGLLPGLIWTSVSLIEQTFLPATFGGFITPTIIVLLTIVIFAVAHQQKTRIANLLWIPTISLATCYWLGLGDINHMASANLQAARQAEVNNNWEQAITWHRRAVFHAPEQAAPQLSLSHAFVQTNRLNEAISHAESAVSAFFTSSWDDLFSIRVKAANLYLMRKKPDDLERAAQLYMEAEQLWRNNTRLIDKQRMLIVNMLYNQACVSLLQHEPTVRGIAPLFEALALNPLIATNILNDDDLASLQLHSLRPPTQNQLQQFLALRNTTVPEIIKLAEKQGWGVHELSQILAYLATALAQSIKQ